MLERYKLRLGDGTVLGVDYDGLSAWLVDHKAMVQSAASGQWQPLKQFLARERAAARRRAARQRTTTRDDGAASKALPLVYPKPRQSETPRQAEAPRPAPVPPPPEPEAIEPVSTELVDPPFIAEPASLSLDFPWADEAAPEPPVASRAPLPEAIPVFTLDVEAPIPLVEPLEESYEEEVAPVLSLAEPAAAAPIPVAEPVAAVAPIEAIEPMAAIEPIEAIEPVASIEPMVAIAPIRELPTREARAAEDALPLEALVELAFTPSAAEPLAADPLAAPAPEPLVQARSVAEPPVLALPRPLGEVVPPPLGLERPSLQVLADDPSTPRVAVGPRSAAATLDALPIIPFKPLDDERPARVASRPDEGDEAEGLYVEAPEHGPLHEAFIRIGARAVSAYDTLLTGWIEGLDHWLRSGGPAAAKGSLLALEAPAWVSGLIDRMGRVGRRAAPPPSDFTSLPTPSSQPTPPAPSSPESLPAPPTQSSPASLPAPPTPSSPPSLRSAPSPRSAPARPSPPVVAPVPRIGAPPLVLKPPPSIGELPTLRLAYVPQEAAADFEDVYEGESRLRVAWFSATRLIGWGGLLAAVAVAGLTWRDWVPKTADLGRAVATRLDAIKENRDRAEQQKQALEEATERVPHLAPETIRLVLAASPTSVLDPPEVFYFASEAADRGHAALTPAEAEQLDALRADLLAALRPSERARLREYDATRARRFVFPFENGDVLELFARGVLTLPAESRARLQELLGKAVAAGLAIPAEPAPEPVAAH